MAQLPEQQREAFSYGDTLGPQKTRETFARVYGNDWSLELDPECLVPTVGATGGISLACSVFEQSASPVAYITDAPTYAGFMARATLNQRAAIYSVEMDAEGPRPRGGCSLGGAGAGTCVFTDFSRECISAPELVDVLPQ